MLTLILLTSLAARQLESNGLLTPAATEIVLGSVILGFATLMAIMLIKATLETRDIVRELKVTVLGEMGLVRESERHRNNIHQVRGTAQEALTRVGLAEDRLDDLEYHDRIEKKLLPPTQH